MRPAALRFFAAVFGCWMLSFAWAQSLQVIELKHRTAQEVIPVLQPLLDPGDALTGQDYTLFVRTSNANLAQLRSVLQQLDRAPRQLLVSVRHSARDEIERERLAVSGTIRSDGGAVSVNETPRTASGATVHASRNRDARGGDGVSSVRVLEGSSAFVSTGESVPYVTAAPAVGRHDRRRAWPAATISWRDLSSGFLVTPRVNGATVVLDIEQQTERQGAAGVETNRLTTQVSGRLGEWVELGGVDESATSTDSGLLSRRNETRSTQRSLWVKVEDATR